MTWSPTLIALKKKVPKPMPISVTSAGGRPVEGKTATLAGVTEDGIVQRAPAGGEGERKAEGVGAGLLSGIGGHRRRSSSKASCAGPPKPGAAVSTRQGGYCAERFIDFCHDHQPVQLHHAAKSPVRLRAAFWIRPPRPAVIMLAGGLAEALAGRAIGGWFPYPASIPVPGLEGKGLAARQSASARCGRCRCHPGQWVLSEVGEFLMVGWPRGFVAIVNDWSPIFTRYPR